MDDNNSNKVKEMDDNNLSNAKEMDDNSLSNAKVFRDKELKDILRAKIVEKRINRSSTNTKEAILENNLKKIGIDKDKFKADLEAVRKQGGLEISMKK